MNCVHCERPARAICGRCWSSRATYCNTECQKAQWTIGKHLSQCMAVDRITYEVFGGISGDRKKWTLDFQMKSITDIHGVIYTVPEDILEDVRSTLQQECGTFEPLTREVKEIITNPPCCDIMVSFIRVNDMIQFGYDPRTPEQFSPGTQLIDKISMRILENRNVVPLTIHIGDSSAENYLQLDENLQLIYSTAAHYRWTININPREFKQIKREVVSQNTIPGGSSVTRVILHPLNLGTFTIKATIEYMGDTEKRNHSYKIFVQDYVNRL